MDRNEYNAVAKAGLELRGVPVGSPKAPAAKASDATKKATHGLLTDAGVSVSPA